MPEEIHKDGLSWCQVAYSREGLNDIDGAIAAYKRAIELEPDNAVALFNLGGMYICVFDTEQAIATWKELIARCPEHDLTAKVKTDFPDLLTSS